MSEMAASQSGLAPVPAHVPPELVRDFDYQALGEGEDILDFWSRLHDGPDIFFTPRHGGHWVLTRHDDVAHVMATYADFSSKYQVVPKGSAPPDLPPIGLDPPLHTDFRRLLAPFFTPKSISDLEVKARNLTLEMLDSFADKGECEFVSQFALTMPIGIFMSLVDLPESDRLYLLDIAEDLVRGETGEARQAAFHQAFVYLEKVYEERRNNLGHDALSVLLQGKVDGGRSLTQTELLNAGALLLAGGLDTVAGMMGYIALFLARNPAHRRRLVENPAEIPSAIEEMMRRHSSANVSRVVTHDLEYKGIVMKDGDMVLTATSAAGIDPRRFERPLEIDFDRADKKSLVFGRGPHQCIGAFLARTEIRVFLTEWLKRIPDFSVAPGKTPIMASGSGNSVLYLPLVWDVKK